MDKGTVIGFVGIIAIVLGVMWHGSHGAIGIFYSTEGVFVVLIGSVLVTMMAVPWPVFMALGAVTKKCFFTGEVQLEDVVKQLSDLASVARQDGLLALESEIPKVQDPFLVEGLKMLVDGKKADEVETSLRLGMHGSAARHKQNKKLFGIMGNFGPSLGLTVTIIGQVVMFQNMGSDIAAIGGAMAIALLGTLYGCLLANCFCLPLAEKLDLRHQEEELIKELYLRGIIAIAEESSPTVLKQTLLAFLDRRAQQRASMAS